MKQETIKTTIPELAKAFTKWEAAYRRNPKRFQTESQRLSETPKTYGEWSAPYFVKILKTGRT